MNPLTLLRWCVARPPSDYLPQQRRPELRLRSFAAELVLLCASCDRSDRSAWPEVAPGLTPDSIQQKYAQTVVSTRIVPGCVQFLGAEKRFYAAWVKTGKAQPKYMFSAVLPITDI